MEEINNSLKENEEKAVKQVKEMIQDSKIKIETIKKTQTKGNFGNVKYGKMIRSHKCKHKQLIQDMEERISSAEDTIEEIDSFVNQNIKSNQSLT